jgi:hypothetical protein
MSKLIYVRSSEKSIPKVTSCEPRIIDPDIRKNESYRREEEIREIQKSLIAKRKEI